MVGSSLSQRVSDHILDLIARGAIRPGELLPAERELMEELGVGRSSVREGMRGLSLMGIVEARRRRGTILATPLANPMDEGVHIAIALWAIGDLFKVRALLEGEAAAQAARHATAADMRRIDAHAGATAAKIRAGRGEFRENMAFHMSIARASRNPVLAACIGSVIGGLREVRQRLDRALAISLEQDIREHAAILAAIRSHDPARARRAMLRHLGTYVNRLQHGYFRRPRRRGPVVSR